MMQRFRTVLVFAPMTYDATRARKHGLLFAARDAGCGALYVEPPNSRPGRAAGGGRPFLNRAGAPVATKERTRVLAVPKKWRLGAARFCLPARWMESPQSSWLASALDRVGLERPVLAIVTSARWTRILRGVEFDTIVYDKNDEPDVLRGWLSREEYRTREVELLERADLLVGPSRRLLKAGLRMRPGLPSQLIRNGVDYRAFDELRGAPVPELDGETRPVVGFVGTVAWFTDVELIAEAAAANPGFHFPIVGPVQSGVDVAALEALPNVSLWGSVPHERVPAIVNRFDACLIPFRAGPISDSLCPVKFFEYLSLGKPVVSTPMPELDDLADLTYSGRDDFAAHVAAAVAENDPDRARERRRVGREYGWDRLFAQLLEAIPKTLG